MFIGKIQIEADKTNLIAKCIKVGILIVIFAFFWCNTQFYMQMSDESGELVTDFFRKRIVIITAIFLAGTAISLWKIKLPTKIEKWLLPVAVALTPIVNFLVLEYTNIGQSRVLFSVFKELGAKKSVMTLIILFLIMTGIYVITNRLKITAIVMSVIVALFGLLCHYVYLFRGIPFLASDLSTAGAAVSVMDNYQYEVTYQIYFLVLATVFWCVLITSLKKEAPLKWKVRAGATVSYAIIMAITIHTLFYTPLFTERLSVALNTFRPERSYTASGAILTVFRSVQLLIVERPEGYSVKASEEIAKQYAEETITGAIKPNVIVIMNEAFADLQEINDFATNKEVIPYFRSLKENVVRGDMYVSSYGGRTANTEFEFLTGGTQAFTPPSATPYQLYIKDILPSFTWELKSKGYQGNIAVHPFAPTGYNRNRVYPLLGFDEFFSVDDFEGAKKVRQYVSDEAMYDRIIEEYEAAKKTSDEPFYTFNVTMQNHTAYAKDFDNLQKDIEILDEKFKNPDVERYLNLINISDTQLERLITYFEGQEEPTVVVFFGDHQPKLPNAFYKALFGKNNNSLTDEELMEKYKTPFIIWANYDIEEQENIKTSTNYLASLVLESSKMNKTGWRRFLTDISKEIPVVNVIGHFGADGKYYDNKDETSPYYETLKKYQILHYNYMFDKGNRIEGFFD